MDLDLDRSPLREWEYFNSGFDFYYISSASLAITIALYKNIY